MRRFFLIDLFESNYCRIVFVISLILIYFLTPKKIFYSYYTIIGVLFILFTSFVITCFIRNIKEKVSLAKSNGASIFGILAIIFGFGALQACTIGSPICGASIGAGFLALFFPGVALNLLEKYSIWILIFSLIIQVFVLYFMNCFKEVKYTLSKK